MDASAFHKIEPKIFYGKFLEAGIRPTGHHLTHVRKTAISPNSIRTADASSMVKVGNTTVVCGLKLEVGAPLSVSPKDGRISVGLTLKPLCSSKFEIGADNDLSVSVAQLLSEVVEKSGLLDFSQFCIQDGKSVWVVHADLVCLDFDGNIVDAALLALVSALKELKLPETHIDEDDAQAQVMITDGPKTAVVMDHVALPLSFISIDKHVLADPRLADEEVADASWTIVMNEQGKLLTVYKPGGKPVPVAQLQACMKLCEERVPTLLKLL